MSSPLILDAQINEIPSLLIPMVGYQLLLPTVSVAEMIPYQAPDSNSLVNDAPPWYLGNLSWRGAQVPMISFEAINGEPVADIQASSQLAILNNTGQNPNLNFLAMPSQGIPHLCRIVSSEISENTQSTLQEYEQMQVFVAGEQAAIPDLEKLEQACIGLLGL